MISLKRKTGQENCIKNTHGFLLCKETRKKRSQDLRVEMVIPPELGIMFGLFEEPKNRCKKWGENMNVTRINEPQNSEPFAG